MVQADSPRDRIGTVLRGKWRLDALLGVGGTGVVYAATHRNGRRAAIKVLRPGATRSRSAVKRALREGLAANRVEHPGAVTVLDDDVTEDGTAFLVMELLRGKTLQAVLDADPEPLALPLVLRITAELAEVLAAAHASGVVHRDLKPSNVFLTDDGAVKLLDFGVAALTSDDDPTSVTATGGLLGTPAFMAPEQARGRAAAVDARTDVWGLGALLYVLLTRRSLHSGETRNEVLISAATCPVQPVAGARPDLPSELAELIDRALAFESAERFRDAAEFARALARIDHSDPLPPDSDATFDPRVVLAPEARRNTASPNATLLGETDGALSHSQAREPSRNWHAAWVALGGVVAVLGALVGIHVMVTGVASFGAADAGAPRDDSAPGHAPAPSPTDRFEAPSHSAASTSSAPVSVTPAPQGSGTVEQGRLLARGARPGSSTRRSRPTPVPSGAAPQPPAERTPSVGRLPPLEPPDPLDVRR